MSRGSTEESNCDLPGLPSLLESFLLRGVDANIEDIAMAAHNEWIDWSHRAEKVLQRMADQLLNIDIPTDEMVLLIQRASNYPLKPSIPVLQESDNDSIRANNRGEMVRLENDWANYAQTLKGLHVEIARVRDRYDNGPHHRADRPVEEMLNLAQLSISKGSLGTEDLRYLFSSILKDIRDSEVEGQRQRHAIREAEAMTDAESEAYVDSLNKLSLE